MDFLLKKFYIPKSSKDCYIIKPYGKLSILLIYAAHTFITGISSQYSFDYDPQTVGYMLSEEEFNNMVNDFNRALSNFWPCTLSISIGYIFALFTCGLSFLIPNLCIGDAEKSLRTRIEYYNKYRLVGRGLELELKKECSTSWIELRII